MFFHYGNNKFHLSCRAVRIIGNLYKVCCSQGVINKCFPVGVLTSQLVYDEISIENWHLMPVLTIDQAFVNNSWLQKCLCKGPLSQPPLL